MLAVVLYIHSINKAQADNTAAQLASSYDTEFYIELVFLQQDFFLLLAFLALSGQWTKAAGRTVSLAAKHSIFSGTRMHFPDEFNDPET